MQVANQAVVSIDYTLTDDQGNILDSSQGGAPLSYIHGVGSIIPGLEATLKGKVAGDNLKVRVAPADGYGEHDPVLMHEVERAQFPADADLEIGMQFRLRGPRG